MAGLFKKIVGPGLTPFINKTPMMIAAIASPGMPKTRDGMNPPLTAALLAAPAAANPSVDPLPNFSGSRANRLASEYEIHAAMSAPAPGNIPSTVPRILP